MAISINDPVSGFGPRPTFDLRARKNVWTYLSAILLVVGLGAALTQVTKRQQLETAASGGATISFLTENKEVKVGDAFDVDVFLDTKDHSVTNAHVYVNFSEDIFEPIGISGGIFLPDTLEQGQTGPGTAFIHVGNPTAQKGIGPIASLRLQAKKTGTAHIEFSSETVVVNTFDPEPAMNLIEMPINLKIVVK